MEYEQASGRGPTPLPYLSYFCMWWAGAVAIDVTTSGCVALVEAAPPTDAFNIYNQLALLPYLHLCATREPCCVCPFPAPLFVEERCTGHWTQQRALVSFTAPYFLNLCIGFALRSGSVSRRCPRGSAKQEPQAHVYVLFPTTCRVQCRHVVASLIHCLCA